MLAAAETIAQPIWQPSAERIRETIAREYDPHVSDYDSLHAFSISKIDQFWGAAWDFFEIVGEKGSRVVSEQDTIRTARWFPEARLNFAENLLRRRDDSTALIALTEDGQRRTMTRRELHAEVSRLSQALIACGIGKGDRVVACLPNAPEAVVALLATAAIGAIWCACSADYGVQSLLDRIVQLEPKALLIGDGYRYNGRVFDTRGKAAALSDQVETIEHVIVVPHLESRPDLSGIRGGVSLQDLTAGIAPTDIAFERFPFEHPLFVMFSSGTTGKPKAIIHHAGGHLISHLKDMVLQGDLHPADICFWHASTGWVIWAGTMPALAWDATLVLYEGSLTYPRTETLFDIVQSERPARIRIPPPLLDRFAKLSIRPAQTHDLSSLRTITSGGAPLLPHLYDYVYSHIKADVHLSSPAGGTDVNTTLVSGNPTGPVYRGETQTPALGIAVDIFDDKGQPVRGGPGELVCTRPFPSMAVGFWNDPDDQNFRQSFFSQFPGVWRHGDWAEITQRGKVVLHGRSDATLKINGVRMGTAEIYRGLEKFPQIQEAIAIGHMTEAGDQIVLFLVLAPGEVLDDELAKRIREEIRARATARHVPAIILQAPEVPHSVNGKPSEIAVRNAVSGAKVSEEGLINPSSLTWFRNLPFVKRPRAAEALAGSESEG